MSEKRKTSMSTNYTKTQLYLLTALRVIIGYHFLNEGLNKLFANTWSSGGFLIQSNWIFSDLFIAIANSPTLIYVSDFLNIWGQILIGLGLMLGFFSRYAAFAGATLLLLYYVALPPFLESYTFVDRNLLELIGLLITALFQTSHIIGLDGLLSKVRSVNNG